MFDETPYLCDTISSADVTEEVRQSETVSH